MKSLENKLTLITIQGEENKSVPVDYATLIKIVCNTPDQRGYSIQDIKFRLTISDIVSNKKVGIHIHLENADAKYLQNLVENMKWGFIHKDLISFSEDVGKMIDIIV